MKVSVFAKVACAAALSVSCIMGMAACSGDAAKEEGGSGLVAATVNGVEISEDVITSYIDLVRAQMALDTEEAWAAWLVEAGYTPESLREMILESYIEQEVIALGAVSRGVEADASVVDSYVSSMKSYYSSEEEWNAALASAGLTEAEYRRSIELSLLQTGLSELFTDVDPATDEELMEYLSLYGVYYDGAKRSSHILFSADDAATAQEALDKINSGELNFADAAAQYSLDGSAADGGNIGLDSMLSLAEEYKTALDALSEGEVSGLVESSYGIHIIMCTYEFHAPETPESPDQYPTELVQAVESTVISNKQSTAYNEWLAEFRETCEIVINPIPATVSYNVDLSAYQVEAEGEGEAADEEATTEDAE